MPSSLMVSLWWQMVCAASEDGDLWLVKSYLDAAPAHHLRGSNQSPTKLINSRYSLSSIVSLLQTNCPDAGPPLLFLKVVVPEHP